MKDEIRSKILQILPYLRCAIEDALAYAGGGGKAEFGVLGCKENGTGKVVCRFSADFIEDLAKLVDAPALTDEDREKARTEKFLSEIGL